MDATFGTCKFNVCIMEKIYSTSDHITFIIFSLLSIAPSKFGEHAMSLNHGSPKNSQRCNADSTKMAGHCRNGKPSKASDLRASHCQQCLSILPRWRLLPDHHADNRCTAALAVFESESAAAYVSGQRSFCI